MKNLLHGMLVASLLTGGATALAQQVPGDMDVIRTAEFSRFASRPNEVIIKFKDSSRVNIPAAQSVKFRASGVSAVDQLFAAIGVAEVEQLMPLTGATPVANRMKAFNGKTVDAPAMNKVYRLTIDPKEEGGIYDAINKLKACDDVEFAEPNFMVYSLEDTPDTTPDDPYYSLQWGISDINLDYLWGQPVLSKEGPVVAILDTGVDIMHPDLYENIWVNMKEATGAGNYDDDRNGYTDDVNGWDFVNQTGVIADYNGHGTHCAGIAAACGYNRIGIIGANPYSKIMPLTVLQSNGQGDIATIIKAIDYAAANGAEIISMSLGTYAESMALEQALGRAYQTAVLVGAAGNDGYCLNHAHKEKGQNAPMPMFPAAYTFVIGVQASQTGGSLAGFSNYDDNGPTFSEYSEEKLYNYEVTAPGVSVMSTYPNGQYKYLNGTSMATPLVAGAISRLLQAKEYSNREELLGDLIRSQQSKGILDMMAVYNASDADRLPELQLVNIEIEDAEGDGDGIADAGETVSIYPVIRNLYGNAANIRYSIEMAEEANTVCEFIDKDVDFGWTLSSYGKNRAKTPFRIKFKENVVDGRICRFKLIVTCDNMSEKLEQEFQLTAENGVEIGGLISEDLTLSPGKNYIINKMTAVPEGVTLTIEPGTVVKFKNNTGLNVEGNLICDGEPGNMITFTNADLIDHPEITIKFNSNISYCKIEGLSYEYQNIKMPLLENIILRDIRSSYILNDMSNINKSNIYENYAQTGLKSHMLQNIQCSNIVFNSSYHPFYNVATDYYIKAIYTFDSNVFGNELRGLGDRFSIGYYTESINKYTSDRPNYLGSSRQDIVQPTVLDFNTGYGFGTYDLSNMLTRPSAEAHGIVWKVVVDGYDAQDEFEMLPPLGVGRHKFEVYFNRPMNKEKAPMVAMGVRAPYTQTAIGEEGAWNEAGDVYTAYLTINGKQNIDGLNRIYVAEAEDDEFFEIPIERFRFNVNVQAAGSMSEGFAAEAGLGRVNLTWENPEDDVDDMLGYNLYRYSLNSEGLASDTICINTRLIEPQDTEFTDYDVTTGTTYCYYYKVMRTSMTEIDPSKTVAATPLTSVLGDANGSAVVDVADVITTVNYASGMNPKPFIFEAADRNSDNDINILDVVGIINAILNPEGRNLVAAMDQTAKFNVEDGILYLDTPVEVAGIQVNLNLPTGAQVTPLDALNGFERNGAWIGENEYIFMAYNLSGHVLDPGRYAILNIGDGEITNFVVSDRQGHNVETVAATPTGVDTINGDVKVDASVRGIYTTLGVKIADNAAAFDMLPQGVYIVNGQKVIK